MATMGVIPYNAIQTHGKLQVLQQSSTNNANNERRGEVIILRRKPTAIIGSTTKPTSATVGTDNNNTSVNNKNAISANNASNGNNGSNGSNGSNTGKAPRGKRKGSMISRTTPLVETSGGGSGGGAGMVRTQNPPPVAVARRNARERNRVKQVNNGFATLRQHIPASVASAYTSTEHTGRGASKKLSKVETLRMAVDYIRSLQQMLSIDEDILVNDNSPVSLLTASPSPSASSHNPSLNQNYVSFEDDNEHDASSVLMEDSSSSCMDTSPASASPSVRVGGGVGGSVGGGGQYSRGGNLITLLGTHDERKTYAYQYECDENLAPLQLGPGAPISTLGRMTLITSGQRASGDLLSMGHLHDSKHDVYQQSSPIQNTIRHPTASLSPGVYSEQSMSPSELDNNSSTAKLDYLPEFSTSLKSPIMNSSLGVVVHPNQTYHTLQQLTAVKKEDVGDEMDDHGDGNHMVDMMTWWEHDQRIRENSP